MLRPHAPGNGRPPLTSAPARRLWRARSRGSLPRRFAPPPCSSPSGSLSHWNFPSRLCPATILPTRGSSLSPRRRAAGRARPPRDRSPRCGDRARRQGDRPPRPRLFASAACNSPQRRLARTPASSVARDPATISRPSSAVAVAGTDAHSRPTGRGRRSLSAPLAAACPRTLSCCGRRGYNVSTAAVLPGRASWTPGGHLCLSRPRLQGRTLRSPFPVLGGGTSRTLAAVATSELAKPSVGLVLSPALHVVSEEDAER